MYRYILCLLILIESIGHLHGQYGNVWVFGDSAGIDFNTSPPTSFRSSVSTNEGVASICDDQGRLLFYTDGTSIWDRYHQIMPNGQDLIKGRMLGQTQTSSTSQGALIIPIPGRLGKYYVFSLGCAECPADGQLYYSMVDMDLNDGKGDVVPETKAAFLTMHLTEYMTAVAGNQCNIWLIVASKLAPEIKAYNVTSNGVDKDPVISEKIAAPPGSQGRGCVDVSPDRTKLAVADENLVLYNFDATSGKISNPLELYRNPWLWGVAFSPDNSKLYASAFSLTYQFNLDLPDTNLIKASGTVISEQFGYYISRAPDGKMYISHVLQTALSVINKPNELGIACDYQHNTLKLSSGRSMLGLPNAISTELNVNKMFYSSHWDTIACADFTELVAHRSDGAHYRWQDGSLGQKFKTDTSGTYWVSYNKDCEMYIDTFHLVFYKNKRMYRTAIVNALCAADTVLLQAKELHASQYVWEDQLLGTEKIARKGGIYWVSYQIDSLCAYYADTFDVRYPHQDPRLSFVSDSLYCTSEQVLFQNTSNSLFNVFHWRLGDGRETSVAHPQYQYHSAGQYEVVLTGSIDGKCMDSTRRQIFVDSIVPVSFTVDKRAICQGEAIRFFPRVDTYIIALRWQYAAGESMVADDKDPVLHAFAQPGLYPVVLTAINRACPETYFTDTIEVFPSPLVFLGQDSALCWKGHPIFLKNRALQAGEKYHYLWNTGDTTQDILVVKEGMYWLQLTHDSSGCAATGSINIAKDCYIDIPNTFSPNSDGHNDYFFPEQVLIAKAERFKMQVFNRWGQMVFATSTIEGRGWDGRFNGKEQPGGVYIYYIELMLNGGTERYQGNITLLR